MPRLPRGETEEQRLAAGRRELQEALRGVIGDFTLGLAIHGHADLLNADEMRPIVRAWHQALAQPSVEPKPQVTE